MDNFHLDRAKLSRARKSLHEKNLPPRGVVRDISSVAHIASERVSEQRVQKERKWNVGFDCIILN